VLVSEQLKILTLGVEVGARSMVKQRQSKNPKSAIPNPKFLVGVLMGSKSDWETMRATSETLDRFGVAHECRVMSAHRTPDLASEFARTAESRGLEVIIAAAGGAAHLAGVIAAHTILPVLGVPMKSDALNGLDSLLSTVQMPAGIPVATLAIGKAGATNAALLAIAILANSRPELRKRLRDFRAEQEKTIREVRLD
jgi:5-(carboxyamino)imidazole ribonucleotide mutase